jgi:glycopeptide antibiotics resistance protein
MKKINSILTNCFHLVNLLLIVFYLYPGSILGYVLYNNSSIQPQITRDFLISSNHFYVFIFFTTITILAHHKSKKINSLIIYVLFLSIFLELMHLIIPNRSFELRDLFGNILGFMFVVIIYKVKDKYV